MTTISISQSSSLARRSVLTLADLSREEIRTTLDLAKTLKRDYTPFADALKQRAVVLLFEKPSLRTRVSLEIGIAKLGGSCVYLDHQGSPIGQRETIADYGRNLERWADALVCRVFHHHTLTELQRWTKVPIVNALCDAHHPCQILADALTLEEHGIDLSSMRLAWLGDGNNVCHSLMQLTALFGGHMVVATPDDCKPDPAWVARTSELASATGARFTYTSDARAIAGCDAVYTDAWISMGQSDSAAKKASMLPYQVTDATMKLAGQNALFMHCLPAHRGEEVLDSVMDSPQSVVFDQAENRMHAQNALLLQLLGADKHAR